MPADEDAIRLGAFAAVFLVVALWEYGAPRRLSGHGRRERWPSNIGIAGLNAALVAIVTPVTATGIASMAANRGWGLFNRCAIAPSIALVGSIILLDLAIYLQHIMFHAVPALWRVHRMHHADLDFDVTTGARFHPLEILISLAYKIVVVGALGAPAVGVLVFEVLLNTTSMFNHGNLRLSERVDRHLRKVLVTPDMHRVHHSIVVAETNSNFGFNLPWWDRLLGTYRERPAAGQEGMTIGIEQFRDGRELWIDRMLTQPFRGPTGPYAISARGDA
jgi:sterol desaturase/sphingolipid hydroxylase (fatty acid hydroxylase superfamily)